MNIESKHVTADQAKKLKEKGFRIPTKDAWDSHGKDRIIESVSKDKLDWNKLDKGAYYSAPEQWVVLEWLLAEYGIWIEVRFRNDKFKFKIANVRREKEWRGVIFKDSETPQQAYSEAFDYILENLEKMI